MKEDKSDKWIASSLNKHLEEGQFPYEVGAWESFQKKRKAKKHREILFWGGAVAASLILLFAVSQVFLVETNAPLDEVKVPVLAEAEKAKDSVNSIEVPVNEKVGEQKAILETETSKVKSPEYLVDQSTSENSQQSKVTERAELNAGQRKSLTLIPEEEIVEKQNNTSASNEKALAVVIPEKEELIQQKPTNSSDLMPSKESLNLTLKTEAETEENKTLPEKTLASIVEEEDFPEIPKEQTKVYLGMGVSPGFGSFQQNNTTTSASSLGVGMLLNVDLPGKLTVGSGFGINYLNQQNESQMPVTIAGYRTSQVEKQEINQVQLELPVYFKYPVTRNNSISVQAGFSNLYAINQNAEQVTTVNEQVAVNNSLDASSSFVLASNAVSQTQVLTNDGSRFYPFATVNFGVNIRVLESEKVNYMVMPFYNHQLRSISGFGDNFGMFGASLKLNFGGSEK